MSQTSTAFAHLETSPTAGEVETREYTTFDIVHVVFCITVPMLIVASNAFIVKVLKRGRSCFDEVTSFLFQALAYTDIIGGAVGALIHALYIGTLKKQWSENICRLVPFSIFYCSINSLYLVCLINVQRYAAVTRPFKYMRLATVKRFKVVVCVSNLFVTCLTIIVLPIEGFPFTTIFSSICKDRYSTADIVTSVETKIGLAFMVLAIAIPLIVLSVINVRLLMIAYRASRRLPLVKSKSNRDQQNNGKSCKHVFKITEANVKQAVHRHTLSGRGLKGLKTVIVISVLFYVSCLPFSVALILTMNRGEQSISTLWSYFYFVSLALLLCNCWWNGPVYFFTSKTFRKKSLEVLGLKKRWVKPTEASTRENSSTQSNTTHHYSVTT